jgi:hypothetical protein
MAQQISKKMYSNGKETWWTSFMGSDLQVDITEPCIQGDEVEFYNMVEKHNMSERLLVPIYCGILPRFTDYMREELVKICARYYEFVTSHEDASLFHTSREIHLLRCIERPEGTVLVKVNLKKRAVMNVRDAMEAATSQGERDALWVEILVCLRDFAIIGQYHCGESLLLENFVIVDQIVMLDVGDICIDIRGCVETPSQREIWEHHVRILLPQVEKYGVVKGSLNWENQLKHSSLRKLLPTLNIV